MAIIKNFRTGETYSAKELKEKNIALLGFKGTAAEKSRQYEKYYDRLRNKVRNYEESVKGTGQAGRKINVSEYIFKTETAKKNYGKDYRPSPVSRAIEESTTISTGAFKAGKSAGKKNIAGRAARVAAVRVGGAFTKTGEIDYEKTTGLFRVSKHLQEAYKEYGQTDPQRFAEELRRYGKDLNAQRAAAKVEAESGVPFARGVVYE